MSDLQQMWISTSFFVGAVVAGIVILSQRLSGGGKPPTSGMPPSVITPDFCRDLDALQEAFEPRSRPGPRPGFPLP